MIKWIDSDMQQRDHSLFYFVHVFDSPLSVSPPARPTRERRVGSHRTITVPRPIRRRSRGETGNYIRLYERDHDLDPDLSGETTRYHSLLIEYTAEQVT